MTEPDDVTGTRTAYDTVAASYAQLLGGALAASPWDRALRPGGVLLVAFQAGDDEPVHSDHGYGHARSLTAWRLDPDRVADQLTAAGFGVRARVVREPEPPHERSPQAHLFAVREG